MAIKKIIYLIAGLMSFLLAGLGIMLPLLPAFPFLLICAYCFARSSKRINDWFLNSRLYKNNLETYGKGQGMTYKTKIKIMVFVSICMMLGFFVMDKIWIGRLILCLVWLFHIIYFVAFVKTIPSNE